MVLWFQHLWHPRVSSETTCFFTDWCNSFSGSSCRNVPLLRIAWSLVFRTMEQESMNSLSLGNVYTWNAITTWWTVLPNSADILGCTPVPLVHSCIGLHPGETPLYMVVFKWEALWLHSYSGLLFYNKLSFSYFMDEVLSPGQLSYCPSSQPFLI